MEMSPFWYIFLLINSLSLFMFIIGEVFSSDFFISSFVVIFIVGNGMLLEQKINKNK